jgi:ankyrin repeat protein
MSGVLPPDVEYAVSRASSQAIAEYFEAGGSADDTSEGGRPLLHMVLSSGTGHRIERGVRAVLAGGPRNVDARWSGRTPLHLTVAKHLGPNASSNLRIIAMLIDAGAAIDARTSGPTGRAGRTPLMLAAQSSRKYDSMRFLLSRGARLDLRDKTGWDVAAILEADGRPNGRAFRG